MTLIQEVCKVYEVRVFTVLMVIRPKKAKDYPLIIPGGCDECGGMYK